MTNIEPRHRKAMPEIEFPPGTRLRFKMRDGHRSPLVFLVLVGGYTNEKDWMFHSSDRPLTSKTFEVVR